MIELNHVTYRYPFSDRNALEDISLTVRPGEAVLCTGVSGCGKSTLIRLINGLCPHYFGGELKGTVRVAGTRQSNDETARDQQPRRNTLSEPGEPVLCAWSGRGNGI